MDATMYTITQLSQGDPRPTSHFAYGKTKQAGWFVYDSLEWFACETIARTPWPDQRRYDSAEYKSVSELTPLGMVRLIVIASTV